MNDPIKEPPPSSPGLPPSEGIPSLQSDRPQENTSLSPDVFRYRPGIAALAAAILIVCVTSHIIRWADDRFFPEKSVARVVCRDPAGGVEIVARGTTVGEALTGWGQDTSGIPKTVLKRKITDGSRITVVDTRWGRRVIIEELSPAERYALRLNFDINRATPHDLELIPGIGEISAKKVFAYRRAHGDFTSEAQLRGVPALGIDKARIIARYVSFGTNIGTEPASDDLAAINTKTKSSHPSDKLAKDDPPVDINRAEPSDLTRIPGVGELTAQRIVDCREKNGPFRTVADLEKVEGIGKKKAEKIGQFVRF